MFQLFKSKTINFGLLLAALTGVQQYMPELKTMLGSHVDMVTGVVGIAVIVLRFMTTQPVGDK